MHVFRSPDVPPGEWPTPEIVDYLNHFAHGYASPAAMNAASEERSQDINASLVQGLSSVATGLAIRRLGQTLPGDDVSTLGSGFMLGGAIDLGLAGLKYLEKVGLSDSAYKIDKGLAANRLIPVPDGILRLLFP